MLYISPKCLETFYETKPRYVLEDSNLQSKNLTSYLSVV
jgi:hypothetical protein